MDLAEVRKVATEHFTFIKQIVSHSIRSPGELSALSTPGVNSLPSQLVLVCIITGLCLQPVCEYIFELSSSLNEIEIRCEIVPNPSKVRRDNGLIRISLSSHLKISLLDSHDISYFSYGCLIKNVGRK